MFWQKCRKVFSNLAFQRSLPLTETQFVLNLICQSEERERERERERVISEKSV